jgi:hypothetical protein
MQIELEVYGPPVPRCAHAQAQVELGEYYDHCHDCGATRSADRWPFRERSEWHSCEICRLPPPYVATKAIGEVEA